MDRPAMQILQRRIPIALLVLCLLAACSLALGADATAQPPAQQPPQQPGLWSKLFNSTLGLLLLFIFLPVIITTFVAARQRDRCLKTFNKYPATVYRKAAKPVWGTMRVFSKGLVLAYDKPVEDPARPAKMSFMMYEPDLENIFAIFRYHDEMGEKNQRRRERQIRRLAYPGIILRTWRRLRNLINTLRDAFNKAIGALLGQLQRAKPGSKMLATGGKQIEGVGTQLLGQVANAYEPLLEHHIATPVVVEIMGPAEGQKKEYGGHLGEYSSAYVMILGVETDLEDSALIGGRGAFEEQVRAAKTDDQIEVSNALGVPVRVVSVELGGQAAPISAEVPAGETVRLPVSLAELTPAAPPEAPEGESPPPPSEPKVNITTRRKTDIIAPRAHAIVRHGGVASK